MTYALAPSQHRIVELFEVKCIDISRNIFEPNHGVARAILKAQHVDFALFLVLLKRRRNGFSAV